MKKPQPTEIRENSADLERRGITAEYIAEQLRWQKTPEGIAKLAAHAKRIAAAAAKARPARFPELAKRGTAPIITSEADRRKWARWNGFNLVDKQIADMKLTNLIR